MKNLPLPPTRIVVVDDYALVRAGVRALLEKIEGVEVIGEAAGGKEALQLINELVPDVVFLDVAVPDLNGLELLREVTKLLKVRVIVLTDQATGDCATQALRCGAAGFLPKSAAGSELELALRTVMNSERYLSPNLTPVETGSSGLTARQLEVLQLIAMGKSTKDIADALKISVKTVETHRAQLMDRLGIHDVAGLVRYAIRIGLVTIDY